MCDHEYFMSFPEFKKEARKDLVFYEYDQWKNKKYEVPYDAPNLYNGWFTEKVFINGQNYVNKEQMVKRLTGSKLTWMFSGFTVR